MFSGTNKILCRLSLEWNNVGTYEEGFRELCEGLALNSSLQYLDLRSNNIDHNGAVQLASAFVSNNSLLEVGTLIIRHDNVVVFVFCPQYYTLLLEMIFRCTTHI